MRKVAIYVEGMTELVFVYHSIFAHFGSDWTAFHLDYVSSGPSDPIDLVRPYGSDESDNHFLVYNCGSDGKVIPTMKDRFQSHLLQGFTGVVGLQDIYGARFFDEYNATHQHIERAKVDAMMNDLESTVARLDPGGTMKIRFAIMEIESWILAMPDLLLESFPGIPIDRVASQDPEVSYVHPFRVLQDLVPYEKSFRTIEGIFSKMTQSHIDAFLQSGKCASFARFYSCLFN